MVFHVGHNRALAALGVWEELFKASGTLSKLDESQRVLTHPSVHLPQQLMKLNVLILF